MGCLKEGQDPLPLNLVVGLCEALLLKHLLEDLINPGVGLLDCPNRLLTGLLLFLKY